MVYLSHGCYQQGRARHVFDVLTPLLLGPSIQILTTRLMKHIHIIL